MTFTVDLALIAIAVFLYHLQRDFGEFLREFKTHIDKPEDDIDADDKE